MGSKGGGDTEVTQRTEIPAFLRPFVKNQAAIGNRALTNLEGQLSGAGADELVAGFDPAQTAAQERALAVAGGAGGFLPTAQQEFLRTAQGVNPQSFIDPSAYGALQSTAQGDFLFGGEGFQQAVDAAIRASQPAILSTFGGSGRGTGGLAQAAIAQQATDAFASQFGNERQRQLAAAGILGDFGNTERARQLQAAGVLPQIGLADVGILENVGGQRQAQAQRELTAPISANESILAAAGGGIPLQSLLGAVQTQPGQGGSSLAGGLTGGLGGALTGAQIGSIVPGLGTGIGAGIGGGLGLLGGLLS